MFSAASVCQFVCLFVSDNFRTIKHRMMKLGGYVHSTKISPEFEFQGYRLKVKVTGVTGSLFGSRPLGEVLVRHFFGSGPRGRGPPAVLRRWENQRMLSSFADEFKTRALLKRHAQLFAYYLHYFVQ